MFVFICGIKEQTIESHVRIQAGVVPVSIQWNRWLVNQSIQILDRDERFYTSAAFFLNKV